MAPPPVCDMWQACLRDRDCHGGAHAGSLGEVGQAVSSSLELNVVLPRILELRVDAGAPQGVNPNKRAPPIGNDAQKPKTPVTQQAFFCCAPLSGTLPHLESFWFFCRWSK